MTGVYVLLGGMMLFAGAVAVLDWLDRRGDRTGQS